MHIWKTNQVQVKCKKKKLADGGSDVFHVKLLLGEGERKFFFVFFLNRERERERERDLVSKLKEWIYNSKILIFGSGIWCG